MLILGDDSPEGDDNWEGDDVPGGDGSPVDSEGFIH